MQIHVLGHLEATVDDRPVALGGAKQRAVLAMLGLEANRPVTADRLIEGLWGEQPPATAPKLVQSTRCESGCMRSACSRSTEAAGRRRRWRRSGTPGGFCSARSGSSRVPSCAT